MSQRGGSVTTHVRWGRSVHSPLTGAGEVDVFLAFEKLEALRYLPLLRPGGIVIVNLEEIEPMTVTSGGQAYPSDAYLQATLARVAGCAVYVDGARLAAGLGNLRVANVVLLGALSAVLERALPGYCDAPAGTWLEVIAQRVPPQYVELNRLAFLTGRDFISKTS